MRLIAKGQLRLRTLFRRRTADSELAAELRFHLDHLTQENISRGMSPPEAAAAARRQMGGIAQLEEQCRDMRETAVIDSLWRDLRYGARVLRRSPGFAAVAVLTLGLGIGATTAIFSVVKAVLLDPLSYHEPDRIVTLQTWWTKRARPANVSGGDYRDLIAQPSPFAAVSRYIGGELPVRIGDRSEFVPTFGTDAGFAQVFQVQPAAGRLITTDEYRTKAPVAFVSHSFATRHFGAPEQAVGRTVSIERRAMSIVGVLPERFHFPPNADVWVPIWFENTKRSAHNYRVVALLQPGVTVDAARAHLSTVGARLQQSFPSSHKEKSFRVLPLRELLVERSRSTLWLLMAASGLVLLVACVNVANLMLARATTRHREMALRAALGAARGRLVRQLLVESSLLGLAGGAVGILVAYAGSGTLLRLAPQNLPRLESVRIDTAVLIFNFVVAVSAATLFGLWPALRAARTDLQDALKQGGTRGVMGGGRGEWARRILVSAEVALALVLTLGAGLLFRSLLALNATDPGYQTEGRLVLTASIPGGTEEQHRQTGATFERIFDSLRQLPGITAVAAVMGLPNGPYGSNGMYAVEGLHDFTGAGSDKLPQAGFRLTSPGYFAAMGVPLLAGRDFNVRDLYESEPVAVVSSTLARQVFAGSSPLGRRVKCGLDRDVWMRVIGVVADMRNEGPATPPGPEIYMPLRQHPFYANDVHIVIRAQANVTTAVRNTISQIEPGMALKISTLENFHNEAVSLPRFRAFLLIAFALVAATLAAAGVYGVMSYTAAQRQPEMGVRIALGASGTDVIGILLGSAARLTVVGLIGGLGLALAAGRLMESMLHGVRPWDPTATLTSVLVLSTAALLAAIVPALRASRVDPADALRQD
ncbi:MAG TPA: ABC transporter permease [Bryobacteraceae bacterium]|nr:ABC transporter permease [Bryobacteraceae bacterium]